MSVSRINLNTSCEPTRAVQRPSTSPQPLHLVKFNPGRISHWGIFLPAGPDEDTGVLWELTFDDREFSSNSKFHTATLFPKHGPKKLYTCQRRNFSLERARKGGRICCVIDGAFSTPDRVDAATDRVMRDFEYQFFSENCQSFAIDTLKTLRRWYPAMVSQYAVDRVKAESAITVRVATSIRQRRDTPQRVYGNQRTPSRPHLTSSSGSSGVTEVSFRGTAVPARSQPARNSEGSSGSRGGTYNAAATDSSFSFGIDTVRRSQNPQQQGPATRRQHRAVATDPLPRSATRQRDPRAAASEPLHYQMPGAWVE